MITSHPNTTMARKGQTKELNCTARGEQPIIIRWERGDTVIDAERNPRYSITINKKGDEVISTLKVRYTTASNAPCAVCFLLFFVLFFEQQVLREISVFVLTYDHIAQFFLIYTYNNQC